MLREHDRIAHKLARAFASTTNNKLSGFFFFFFNDPPTPEIYTLPLHDPLPISQAKGKIERRFGTFQKRLLALLAYEKITPYAPAQELLARELTRQNRTICRTTGLSPDEA